MNNRRPIIILTIAVLSVVLISYLIKEKFKDKYDWYETYKQESKEPYGAFLISELLKTYYPRYTFTSIKKPLEDELKTRKDTAIVNYIFVGVDMYVDSNDVSNLLDFVEKGNNAFIASKRFPQELMDYFCYVSDEDDYHDIFLSQMDSNERAFNFYQSSLKGKYAYTYKPHNVSSFYLWNYFSIDSCDADRRDISLYGYMGNEKTNYFKIKHGKGAFYFHTAPIAFANYNLLNSVGVDYASKVFSFLPEGNIIWDEYSKIPVEESFTPGMSKSPLRFILADQSLRWAWYLTLALVAFYVLFAIKRTQKAIPLILPKENTSLDYVKTIGLMFFQSKAHRAIGMYKMKMFLSFIRSRYFIATNNVDDELKRKISENSSIPLEEIEKIFLEYSLIDYSREISAKELLIFNNLLTEFYNKCK